MITWPLALPETLKLKGPFAWGMVALACFIVFLFLTFPYGPLQNRLLAELNRSSGWEIRAADWSVSFPVGIEWHDVVLTGPTTVGAISLEAFQTTVGVVEAFLGRLVIDYAVQIPGAGQSGSGRATGVLISDSWSLLGSVEVKGHLQQVDLAAILKPYVTRGLVQGDFSHRWDSGQGGNAALMGEGTVKVEIKDLEVERIPAGATSIPALSFGRIQATVACRDAACDVTELKGDGVDGSFTVQGRMMLRQPLQQSLLDLTVTVIPGAGFAQKAASLSLPPFQPGNPVTFKLLGPVMNARVAL
ncbi:MAG: type II secretion system protein GspN [Nitrospiraceae bacterium]